MSLNTEFEALTLEMTTPSDSWLDPWDPEPVVDYPWGEDTAADDNSNQDNEISDTEETQEATDFPRWMRLPVEIQQMALAEAVKDRAIESLGLGRVIIGELSDYREQRNTPISGGTVQQLTEAHESLSEASKILFSKNTIVFDIEKDRGAAANPLLFSPQRNSWITAQKPEDLLSIRGIYILGQSGLRAVQLELPVATADQVRHGAEVAALLEYCQAISNGLPGLRRVTLRLDVLWSPGADISDEELDSIRAPFLEIFRLRGVRCCEVLVPSPEEYAAELAAIEEKNREALWRQFGDLDGASFQW